MTAKNSVASPRVSIVIVNYNSGDYLRRCLRSVLANHGDAEIVLVDNASTDGSLVLDEEVLRRVVLIRNSANVGFARAVNQGIEAASAAYILLLNPDTELLDGAVHHLLSFAESQPGPVVVGGRVNNADGSLQPACFRSIPTPGAALLRLSGLSLLFPNWRLVSRYNPPLPEDSRPRRAGAVSGSFCLFPKEVAKRLGGFDERFFLFGEDLDFCLRAARQGIMVWFVPQAKIVHHKGVSMRTRPITSAFHFYNSMLLFYRKHFAEKRSLALNVLVFIGVWLLALPRLLARIIAFPIGWVSRSLKG